jgi:hypothetical protein
MESSLNSYDDVVSLYIGLISQDSPQAGAAIEQIQTTIGTAAALRAALIITVLRMEVQQKYWIPDIQVYATLIQDYPQAVPLLEFAIGCCFQVWGVNESELALLKMRDGSKSGTESESHPNVQI